jgi:hypothetical protein
MGPKSAIQCPTGKVLVLYHYEDQKDSDFTNFTSKERYGVMNIYARGHDKL